jgi:ribonuclease Z
VEVILLGTGGPKPDPYRQGPALAVRVGHTTLLFDAGRAVTTQLVRAGISIGEVDPLFITHHHFDHIGGLGDFILSSWNLGRETPLSIFGPPGTESIVHLLLDGVYRADIGFRLKEAQISGVPLTDAGQIVKSKDTAPGLIYNERGIKVFCDLVQHGHGLGISPEDWQCLAYRVEAGGSSVAISGDAVDCSGLDALAQNADALVMCCYLSSKEMQSGEGALIGEHILAGSPQAGRIAARAKNKQLILTHIREKDDGRLAEMVAEIKAAYDGKVVAGKDLMRIRV